MKRDSRQILITVELIGSESILAKVTFSTFFKELY